ncbi:Asparagine--tRNA ligase [Buchnera aphidicola (Cinara kochiana kochiana)]|uniref:Asparagine--tRNA ligase n=1 Tax=Buchnera aphidicola (Cinara kochiana kochiana) TaxID=2518976 RepID=A0A451D5K8_9GAMM|nr:asparagine--tRNA ligase [Buchnera aphidicola]VFP81140.1 Asparagine--tRNA ligase [Buchnera aphidicola (Cinara kochiana kochiana)]
MKKTSISDIYTKNNYINKFITIHGWVRNNRISKIGISFLTVYDGSSIHTVQIIASKFLSNYYTEIIKLTIGCSVVISGILILSKGCLQIYEIKAKHISVLGWIDHPNLYPISAKKHTIEHIRNFCHLRPRTNLIRAISRIRNVVFHSLHQFLDKYGYLWVSTPIITSINAEGAGSMFKVSMLDIDNHREIKNNDSNKKTDFFKKQVFLTVSGQLTLEAYACALSKVYSLGPTFRAENSNTKKHLTEFWMLEVEKSFSNINDIYIFAEKLLKNSVLCVLNNCISELLFLQKTIDKNIVNRLNSFINTDFIVIEYTEIINILLNNKDVIDDEIVWGKDLSSNQEKYLVNIYFKAPIIVINYPKILKAFYMKVNSDNKTVAAFDILIPEVGEIIGGSEREDRIKYLDSRIDQTGLNKKDYEWYQDLRRYGTVPHAGFGLGLERLIVFITGIKNIREAIPFPRTVGHADF